MRQIGFARLVALATVFNLGAAQAGDGRDAPTPRSGSWRKA
jgi:hypothetical protein